MFARASRVLGAVAAASVAACACGSVGPRDQNGPKAPVGTALAALTAPDAGRLVVVEKGEQGGRLVLVDEKGQRIATLTESVELVLDHSPAWSPDGRWIAFASSRGQASLEDWSLWIVSAAGGGDPVRLTGGGKDGGGVDMSPRWSPDGTQLVFASTRGGAGLDLWKLALVRAQDAAEDDPPRADKLTRLTTGGPEEYDPAWSPRGGAIAYTAVADDASVIMSMPAAGGAATAVTSGPADASPDWTPDGKRLVFVAPAPQRTDTDLWIVDADGGERRHLVDDAQGDEMSPRVARDGRFVLARSAVRDEQGRAVYSSLVVADLADDPPILRALVDRFPLPRMGVDPAPVPLVAADLDAAPTYADAIEDAFARARRPKEDEAE